MDTDTHSGLLTGFRTGEDIDSQMEGYKIGIETGSWSRDGKNTAYPRIESVSTLLAYPTFAYGA
jgi:hypothetical protein